MSMKSILIFIFIFIGCSNNHEKFSEQPDSSLSKRPALELTNRFNDNIPFKLNEKETPPKDAGLDDQYQDVVNIDIDSNFPTSLDSGQLADSGVVFDAGLPKFIGWIVGDSIAMGAHTTGLQGYRKPLWEFAQSIGFEAHFVGTLNNGSGWPETHHDGHSGWNIYSTTGVIKNYFGPGKAVPYADLMTLMIGMNNLGIGDSTYNVYDPKTAISDYTIILETAQSSQPGLQIAVSTITLPDSSIYPTPHLNGVNFNNRLPAVWDLYDKAHSKFPLIRVNGASAITNPKTQLADGIHPNDIGANLLALKWIEAIRPWMVSLESSRRHGIQ